MDPTVYAVDKLAPLVAGPASSTIILLLFFIVLYRMVDKKLIPAAGKWLQDIIDQHREDREAWQESMSHCREHMIKIANTLDRIERRLEEEEGPILKDVSRAYQAR